jgi:hypothetical protein
MRDRGGPAHPRSRDANAPLKRLYRPCVGPGGVRVLRRGRRPPVTRESRRRRPIRPRNPKAVDNCLLFRQGAPDGRDARRCRDCPLVRRRPSRPQRARGARSSHARNRASLQPDFLRSTRAVAGRSSRYRPPSWPPIQPTTTAAMSCISCATTSTRGAARQRGRVHNRDHGRRVGPDHTPQAAGRHRACRLPAEASKSALIGRLSRRRNSRPIWNLRFRVSGRVRGRCIQVPARTTRESDRAAKRPTTTQKVKGSKKRRIAAGRLSLPPPRERQMVAGGPVNDLY